MNRQSAKDIATEVYNMSAVITAIYDGYNHTQKELKRLDDDYKAGKIDGGGEYAAMIRAQNAVYDRLIEIYENIPVHR